MDVLEGFNLFIIILGMCVEYRVGVGLGGGGLVFRFFVIIFSLGGGYFWFRSRKVG